MTRPGVSAPTNTIPTDPSPELENAMREMMGVDETATETSVKTAPVAAPAA